MAGAAALRRSARRIARHVAAAPSLSRNALQQPERLLSSQASPEHGPRAAVSGSELALYPPERVRNFSIIAHVDHGKSTLADRLLELTGTIQKGHGQPQYLDKLQVERERGITVKAQTATMFYRHTTASQESDAPRYLLNLIDTPGHVDFSYEVSRSLAACQGALLVVDAAQGVQAQTIANFYLAFESNLSIIPVINKIDQPTADPDNVKDQLKRLFDIDPSEALLTSAKTGKGLEHVLPAVIERIPSPPGKCDSPVRMLLLDSYYDEYKGVICHVAVVDGALRKGDKIASAATGRAYEVLDVGIMHPELTPTGVLYTGQVGYVISGMRSTKEARIGDTLHQAKSTVEPLPGFKPAKHMVFSGLYPADGSDFEALSHAIEKLTCNDASVSVTKETSNALGMGFRCGFLGLLHMDVFHQRLEQEYGAQVISTIPTVPYIFEYGDGSKVQVENPAALASNPGKRVAACWEPTVIATIIIPSEYVGPVIMLCKTIDGRGAQVHIVGAQITLQSVAHVIIHGVHIHDAAPHSGGVIRDSKRHHGLRSRSDGDGISVLSSSHVWIDHVSMYRCADGLVDVVNGSTGITVSNSHFTKHDHVMLFGASNDSPQDAAMQVTVAFNHFGKGLVQRMPRCRYGFFHVVNNDYTHWRMYAIGGNKNPTIISQGNRFIAPDYPNAKEVTKREYTPYAEYKDWVWKSQGDVMMNGAFFNESGGQNERKYDHLDFVPAKHGSYVGQLTRFAGALTCRVGHPC